LDIKQELDKIDTYKKVSLEEVVSKVSKEKE
jgi:hypothetical protein